MPAYSLLITRNFYNRNKKERNDNFFPFAIKKKGFMFRFTK